jgi:hypothetical protein
MYAEAKMTKEYDFSKLDADLQGVNKVERKRTTILLAVQLMDAIESAYGKGKIGSVLEAGALMKLRRDGHIPEKPEGVEPAQMNRYVATKEKEKEKVAIEEIRERTLKGSPGKLEAPTVKAKKKP